MSDDLDQPTDKSLADTLTRLSQEIYDKTVRPKQHPLEDFTEALDCDERGVEPPPRGGPPSWIMMHPDLAKEIGLEPPE